MWTVKSKTSLPISQSIFPSPGLSMLTDLLCDFPLSPFFFFLQQKGAYITHFLHLAFLIELSTSSSVSSFLLSV